MPAILLVFGLIYINYHTIEDLRDHKVVADLIIDHRCVRSEVDPNFWTCNDPTLTYRHIEYK